MSCARHILIAKYLMQVYKQIIYDCFFQAKQNISRAKKVLTCSFLLCMRTV